MVAGQGRMDAEMRAELLGVTGILGGDDAHFLENAYRAERNALQVPDRGADNIEGAAHGSRAHPSLIGAAQPSRRYAKMPTWVAGSSGHGPKGASGPGARRRDGGQA